MVALSVHGFAQGLAGLEVGYPLFGDLHAFAAAGIAPHACRTVADGKAAESPDLDAVTPRQGVGHAVQNGLDRHFGIAVGQQMSAALSGKASVDQALKTSQTAADREMRKAGYYK